MALTQFSNASLDRVGDLIAALGTDGFSADLFQFFDGMVPIDHCAVYVFPQEGAPHPLVVEGSSDATVSTARELAQEYVAGAFNHDPVVKTIDGYAGKFSHRAVVNTVTSSAIADTAFRRRFYDEPLISEEISIIAEQAGLRYYACLFRNASQPRFAADEINAVQFHSGVVMRALRKQVELSRCLETPVRADSGALSVAKRQQNLRRIRTCLSEEEKLSPREADVCAHIALGYTIVAISLNLGITINTVATHRKRAYAKLGISSQNELFARYLDAASVAGATTIS